MTGSAENKNTRKELRLDMYPVSWTHWSMTEAQEVDAILYFTGGIHFVFAWMRSLL